MPLAASWVMLTPSSYQEGDAFSAVTLAAATGDFVVILIPVSPGLLRASEVAGVGVIGHGHVHAWGDHFVQVIDRVMHQLDQVFTVVGIATRILADNLIVVASFEQTSCPARIADYHSWLRQDHRRHSHCCH